MNGNLSASRLDLESMPPKRIQQQLPALTAAVAERKQRKEHIRALVRLVDVPGAVMVPNDADAQGMAGTLIGVHSSGDFPRERCSIVFDDLVFNCDVTDVEIVVHSISGGAE